MDSGRGLGYSLSSGKACWNRIVHDERGTVTAEMAMGFFAIAAVIVACAVLAAGFVSQARLQLAVQSYARELSRSGITTNAGISLGQSRWESSTYTDADSMHLIDSTYMGRFALQSRVQRTDIAFTVSNTDTEVIVHGNHMFQPLSNLPGIELHADSVVPKETSGSIDIPGLELGSP